MLITISEADIQRAGINAISVGQIGIGPIQIGQLIVTDLALNLATAGAQLRNFRVTITLVITLDLHMQLDLSALAGVPGLPHIDQSHTVNFVEPDGGNPDITVNFGNVSVPGLQNFKIDVASLTADNIAASANPVTNLQLGAATAEQIHARNLKLPVQGFSIAGAAIGSLQANGIGVPAASLDGVTIDRVHGDAFPLGQLILTNLALPNASVADIVSESVDVTATPVGKVLHQNLGVPNMNVDLTLTITPTVQAQVDQLLIGNTTASTSVGRIEMHNVVAPYEFLNLTLSQIGIDSIQIPTFAIS